MITSASGDDVTDVEFGINPIEETVDRSQEGLLENKAKFNPNIHIYHTQKEKSDLLIIKNSLGLALSDKVGHKRNTTLADNNDDSPTENEKLMRI